MNPRLDMIIMDRETQKMVCEVVLPHIPSVGSKISLYGNYNMYKIDWIEYACDNPHNSNRYEFDTLVLYCTREDNIPF